MPKKDRTFDESVPEKTQRYLPVVYVGSFKEAEKYQQLLEDHGVPAAIDEDYQPPEAPARRKTPQPVAVLVPESLLEEAKVFIADMEDMNDLVEDQACLDDEREDEFAEEDLDRAEDEEL